MYKQVFEKPFENINGVVRAKQSRRIPVVFSREEIRAIFCRLNQSYHLIASLLYGSGLRLMEALRLRLKNVDFERLTIIVRSGKDRVTIIPEHLLPDFHRSMERVHVFHQKDLADALCIGKKYPAEARNLH